MNKHKANELYKKEMRILYSSIELAFTDEDKSVIKKRITEIEHETISSNLYWNYLNRQFDYGDYNAH